MLKGLVLVCGKNFHSNRSLRQVRMMLLGRRGCRGMLRIRISNPSLNLGFEVIQMYQRETSPSKMCFMDEPSES